MSLRFGEIVFSMSQMKTSSRADFLAFQGSRICYVPDRPGLYAWYYRPMSIQRELTPGTLTRILSSETQITTQIDQRYGVRVVGRAIGKTIIGAEEQDISVAVTEAFDEAKPFLDWFFSTGQFIHFCRPVYIGIAKNFYERVYKEHYVSLSELWEDTSRVSRFISANGHTTVQNVMDRLDLSHSFALEARVREISSKDLMVSVLVTDRMPSEIGSDAASSDSATRRALERLLQLLSDPICGRR
jgi:hypothetical protein